MEAVESFLDMKALAVALLSLPTLNSGISSADAEMVIWRWANVDAVEFEWTNFCTDALSVSHLLVDCLNTDVECHGAIKRSIYSDPNIGVGVSIFTCFCYSSDMVV